MVSFQENGNLNPGVHNYSVLNFKQEFVENFVDSQSRKEIFEKFEGWFADLIELCVPSSIWLDGSYLTSKENPNDLDMVIFYKPEDLGENEQVIAAVQKIISESDENRCDAYFCLDLSDFSPQDKSMFGQQQIMTTYWLGQFTFDRARRPKGIIEINKDEILSYFGGEYIELATGTD